MALSMAMNASSKLTTSGKILINFAVVLIMLIVIAIK